MQVGDPTAGYVITPHGKAKFISWDPANKRATVQLANGRAIEIDGSDCYVTNPLCGKAEVRREEANAVPRRASQDNYTISEIETPSVKRLVCFAILMGANKILDLAPCYIDEKFRLCMTVPDPSRLLDASNRAKLAVWLAKWMQFQHSAQGFND